MKKSCFFVLAMVGMLFAACSEKEVAIEGGQGDILPEGYMALNINLPTTPSTRAENDMFDDGTADEYKVTDCALLLFEGTTEANATLFNAQKINLPFAATDEDKKDSEDAKDGDNITTSYLATALVKGRTTTGGKLYALALLNYDNVLKSIDTEGLPTFVIVGDDEKKMGKTTKLADIRALVTDVDFTKKTGESSKDYFFMTNAVLSTAQGGNVTTPPSAENVIQLAELDPTKVFDTEAKAKANPAGDILVERAVAKATLKVNLISNSAIKATDIDKIEWTIDNMEPSSYIFRNPGTSEYISEYIGYKNTKSNNYRFVGNMTTKDATSLGSDANFYRTYWCIDPQYKSEATPDNLTPTMKSYDSSNEYDFSQAYPTNSDKAFYCNENTFNVANQNYKNTTRAILKVTLNDNATFYTINGGTDKITDVNSVKNGIVGYIVGMSEVKKAFENQLNTDKTYTVNANSITATYERNSKSGQYEVKTLVVSENAESTINGDDFKTGALSNINTALSGLIETINEGYVVFAYSGGVMYYDARFQHFAGDGTADLAPWNTGEYGTSEPAGGSTANAYPAGSGDTTAEENYLGRYGMVRNNWYDVTVTAFNGLGYPEIPSVTVKKPGYDGPDTPDDNLKEHVAVKIHVLSWAKRTQSWGF